MLADALLDDLVGPLEQRLRDGEPERFGGLEVDDQLELGGLLDGKIAGLRALEDLIHVRGRPPEQIVKVWPIGHEAAGAHDKLTLVVNRRQLVLGRKLDEAGSVHIEKT